MRRHLLNEPRWSVIWAYGVFLGSLLFLYTVLRASVVQEYVAQPLAIAVAHMSGWVLNLLSLKATVSGTVLSVEGFTARIDSVCTGIFVAAIYVSAVLAYPSRVKEKLKGLYLGVSVILVLNLIWVISLMYIGRHFPSFFETAHLLVWQSLIIFAALLMWLYWTQRFVGVPQH